jgi:hypothetical protein
MNSHTLEYALGEIRELKEHLAEKEAQLQEAEDYIVIVHRGLPYGLIKNNYEKFSKIYKRALARQETRTQNKEMK